MWGHELCSIQCVSSLVIAEAVVPLLLFNVADTESLEIDEIAQEFDSVFA